MFCFQEIEDAASAKSLNKFHKMLETITNSLDDDGGDGEIRCLSSMHGVMLDLMIIV